MMSKFKLTEVSLYDIENLSYMGLWVHCKTARIFASGTRQRSNESSGARMMFFSLHRQRILPLTG